MGVTGLWKLIESSGKPVPLETLENKVLAIDISIWLHQVIKGFQDSKGSALPNAHLLGLFNRLCKLLYYRIRPVFVFDGGVPALKRETITKRNQAKNRYQHEADRLQHVLLNSLAKEKVVQQALGVASSEQLALKSPLKNLKAGNTSKDEDDLFKLPPIKEQNESFGDESMTDLSDESASVDNASPQFHLNINSIDVTTSHFRNLPPDIRHEILTDLKETRKQSSWGRLHELPAQSDEFCSFQMGRLLKRRQVQVSLEDAEKEMGGKSLSLGELEAMLSEEGVVQPSDASAKRIASDENSRYIYVKDLKQALQEAKERGEEEIKSAMALKNMPEEEPKEELPPMLDVTDELDGEYESDLQRAIHMSLIPDEENHELAVDQRVQMTEEQKKKLNGAAMLLARGYMMDYAGMSSEDVQELLREKDKDDEEEFESTFKHNSSYIVKGYPEESLVEKATVNRPPENVPPLARSPAKAVVISDSESDTDSDFIDVPDDGSDCSSSQTKQPDAVSAPACVEKLMLEVLIDPNEKMDSTDDLFADIFDNKAPLATECSSKNEKPAAVMTSILGNLQAQKDEICKINLDDLPSVENREDKSAPVVVSDDSDSDMVVYSVKEKTSTTPQEQPESTQSLVAAVVISDDDESGVAVANNELTPTKVKKEEQIQSKKHEDETTPQKNHPFFSERIKSSSTEKDQNTSVIMEETQSKKHETVAQNLFIEDPEAALRFAANTLKETKTTEELQEMAKTLSSETRKLEVERNKQDRLGVSINEQMSRDCMRLLQLFGIPYIVAPMEAEAQCAFLNATKLTDGTITDDSDIWLFGGQTVYKNFFNQNKHVMEFRMENIERAFNIDRHKLIQLAMLVGSDYTTGINGVGAVTALEILATFPSSADIVTDTGRHDMSLLSSLRKFHEWFRNGRSVGPGGRTVLKSKLKNVELASGFPSIAVVQAYLYPTVDDSKEKFTWGKPDVDTIHEFAKKYMGWTSTKTGEVLDPVLKKLNEKKSQSTIRNYFTSKNAVCLDKITVSKRVAKAISRMAVDYNPDEQEATEPVPVAKRVRKKDTDSSKETRKKRKPPASDSSVVSGSSSAPGIISMINGHSTAEIMREVSTKKKREPVLPDANQPIPQRERELEEQRNTKLKAIALFKKSKENSAKPN